MKVDKLVNNLFKKLDNSNKGSSINYYNTNNNNHIKDDDYYLAIGSEPSRFAYYRYLRIQKCDDEYRRQTCEAAYDAITQDELDFALKRKLREHPEERYQREKEHWYWHESSWSWRGLDATGYDGQGCNQFTGCVPECRYYAEYGRIEDESESCLISASSTSLSLTFCAATSIVCHHSFQPAATLYHYTICIDMVID